MVDGDGNYGYRGADDSFVPFSSEKCIVTIQYAAIYDAWGAIQGYYITIYPYTDAIPICYESSVSNLTYENDCFKIVISGASTADISANVTYKVDATKIYNSTETDVASGTTESIPIARKKLALIQK